MRQLFWLSFVLLACSAQAQELQATFSEYVDEQGTIRQPIGYRTQWAHLGTWFVPEDPQAAGPGFHDVYTQPQAVTAYRDSGRFPDGTVLVKEIRGIHQAARTTGQAHWAGDIGVVFVMIRDAEQRFTDHPNWGEGWGWGLFEPGAPQTNISQRWDGDGLSNCRGCHVPAQDSGWVYVDGYPSLER